MLRFQTLSYGAPNVYGTIVNLGPGPEAIKRFSCSTQLSMNFSLLIVGICILISREKFMLSYVWQERMAIISDLRLINIKKKKKKKTFSAELNMKKSFITSGPGLHNC